MARGQSVERVQHTPVTVPRQGQAAAAQQRQPHAQGGRGPAPREHVHLATDRCQTRPRRLGLGLVVGLGHQVHGTTPGQPREVPPGPQAVALVGRVRRPVGHEEHVATGHGAQLREGQA